VRDVLIGARGSATYAVRRIEPTNDGASSVAGRDLRAPDGEILIPLDAVRALRRPDVAIVDERALGDLRRSA
jgi:hypothetical protein